MLPVGVWVEREEAIEFLRQLNLPLRAIRGPRDPALAGLGALIMEAHLPRPRFSGEVFLLGSEAYPLTEAGARRLLAALGPYLLPFFKALVENVRDIVYVVDEAGQAHYANLGVSALGFRPLKPGEPLDLFPFLTPRAREKAKKALQALIEAPGKTLSFHFTARDAQGKTRTLRVWGKNLLHRPEVQGVLLNVRDIGEEIRLREKLAEEAARLEALVTSLPGVVFQARLAPGDDPAQAPSLFQSPRTLDVLGHPPEAFLKDPGFYYENVHPEDRAALIELAHRAVARPGEPQSLVYRFFHGQKKAYIWLRDTLRYDEKTGLLTGFTKDVTEEVERDRAAAESELRFKALAETAPAVILMWQDERLVFVNRTAIELTGYTEAELKSQPIWDFVHPEDREMVKSHALARLRGEAAPARYAFRIRTKAGETRWLDYSAATVKIGGKPAVLGVGLDVTEAKERELDLELLARLAEALRLSDEVQEVMEAALSVLIEFFRAPSGALLLYEHNRAVAHARRGWMAEIPVSDQLEPKSLVAAALHQGETLVIANVAEDPRLRAAARPHVPPGWSAIITPLTAGSSRVGALLLARPGPPPAPAVVRRVERAAEAIGNAVQRAALRERLARRVRDLEVLADLGRTVARQRRVQESAKPILQALLRLPFAAAALFVEDRNQGLALSATAGPLVEVEDMHAWLAAYGKPFEVLSREKAPAVVARWMQAQGFAELWRFPLGHPEPTGLLVALARAPVRLGPEDRAFLDSLVAELEVALESARHYEEVIAARAELADAYEKTLWGWAKAVELRDQETAGHTERVTALAEALGRALGLTPPELADLRRGAILHDVGKLAVPDAILLKPGKLTEEEWAVMKLHPVYAYEWLKNIPYLKGAIVVPRYHHERWDGSGYPEGLRGEAIPLLARIFAVADVYDALTSDRPYRKAWPREQALRHLEENAGVLFDPRVVDIFLEQVAEGF